jgi:hypothetical protein
MFSLNLTINIKNILKEIESMKFDSEQYLNDKRRVDNISKERKRKNP